VRHQLDEALPGRCPLVVLQSVVPLLGVALQVVGGVPEPLLIRSAYHLEELVAAVEPGQWVSGAIVFREAQLVVGDGGGATDAVGGAFALAGGRRVIA
jgi:hypothetical protein